MRTYRPLLVALAIFLAAVAVLWLRVGALTHHLQLYTLDDPYIHAAIARNLLLHGVFGITPYEFTPASSSIAWPFLFAVVFKLFGIHIWLPLALNVVFAVLLCVVASRAFLAHTDRAPEWLHLLFLLLLIFCVPVLYLVFTGMEHIFQVLTTLLFLNLAAEFISAPRRKVEHPSTPFAPPLPLLAFFAMLLTSARYEGLFIAFAAGTLLLVRRQWIAAVVMGIAALLPPFLFGLFLVHHGAHWLPNSLLVKTGGEDARSLTGFLFGETRGLFSVYAWHNGFAEIFLAAVLLLWLTYRCQAMFSDYLRNGVLILIGSCLLHAQFSRMAVRWRYEAYLMAGALMIFSIAAANLIARSRDRPRGPAHFPSALRRILCGGCGVLLLSVLPRAVRSTLVIPTAARAIYQQQYQMARFFALYYPGGDIALNDIGAVNYFGDYHCLDLFGLASVEVADLRLREEYSTGAIGNLAQQHHTQVAMAYRSWFIDETELPSNWIEVGAWTLPYSKDLPVGSPTVSIFAVDPADKDRLIEHLRSFSSQLPPEVIQSGLYTEKSPPAH